MQLWLEVDEAGDHELLISTRDDGAEVDPKPFWLGTSMGDPSDSIVRNAPLRAAVYKAFTRLRYRRGWQATPGR